jgi:hypothetical protein
MDDLELLIKACDERGDDIAQLYTIEAPNDIASYQVGATYYLRSRRHVNDPTGYKNYYIKYKIDKILPKQPLTGYCVRAIRFNPVIQRYMSVIDISLIIDSFVLDESNGYVLK